MSSYGSTLKKICFDSIDKLHADLKICLHYDDIKIRDFFNEIVKGYVEKDEDIISFIDKIKEKKHISKNKSKKVKNEMLRQKEVIKQFGLNKDEIENIFDIIERENIEL
jgi:DNA-binding transcriptional regulator YhcF (GntR family)